MTGFLLKDKFDRNLSAALKHRGIRIASRDENIYTFALGNDEAVADITALKEEFEASGESSFENFADEILSVLKLKSKLDSFTNAQFLLFPFIVKEEEITEEMIALPFAGNIFKAVYCTDESEKILSLDSQYIKKWNTPKEVLFSVADRNMGKEFSKADMSFTEITGGVKAVEFEYKGNVPVSSMILCNDFRETVKEKLGECFLAAIPSENTLFAVQNISEKLTVDLKNAVYKEYEWADKPISTEIYKFQSDGSITVIS